MGLLTVGEVFISEITARAFIIADSNKRRTLSRSDIAKALSKSDQFDFLIDIVPRDELPFPGPVGSNGAKKASIPSKGKQVRLIASCPSSRLTSRKKDDGQPTSPDLAETNDNTGSKEVYDQVSSFGTLCVWRMLRFCLVRIIAQSYRRTGTK